ncbi:hypothetical protein GCM10022384_64850 [Streptomyces marokkonensis]|uniref:Putative Flp pilus-assembly TadG-like N-terminal domain-containing protein n=1 Tax=Streptomyces marokkonensis TaxID=324855 RepID=A0ABP7SEE3_9ACTN
MWSVGAISVLCVVFGIVLALGQAVVARHRAAGGADLAALAAADHWARGGTAACARADRVARAQGTQLVRCVLTGQISDVTAASGRGPFTAEVRARAGPATGVPPNRVMRTRATDVPPNGAPVAETAPVGFTEWVSTAPPPCRQRVTFPAPSPPPALSPPSVAVAVAVTAPPLPPHPGPSSPPPLRAAAP